MQQHHTQIIRNRDKESGFSEGQGIDAHCDSEAKPQSAKYIDIQVQDCSSWNSGDASTVQHSQDGKITYSVSSSTIRAYRLGMKTNCRGALVDRGANGSIIGNNARIIRKLDQEVDVTGIDNHELNSLKMVDAAAKAYSQRG